MKLVYFLIGFIVVLLLGQSTIVVAQQDLRPDVVSAQVYQLLPEFPKENDYVNRETNQIEEENTLLYRFISYHQFVKRRPVGFRLDWKLTLADYLGINEGIIETSYPGYKTLATSPLLRDKEIIQSLNQRQRNELVTVLISIYQPETGDNPNSENPGERNPAPYEILPKPGDSELLKP